MSFAATVKDEICRNRAFIHHHREPLLYGVTAFGRDYKRKGFTLYTENNLVARLMAKLLYEVVNIQATVTIQEHSLRGIPYYLVTVDDSDDGWRVQQTMDKFKEKIVMPSSFTDDTVWHGVLSGAFLVCGNMTNPVKSYHLEFTPHEEFLASDLWGILHQVGITAKRTVRRGQQVLYSKDSEQMEEFLTMVGASKSALDLMNIKIYKDVRNNVNRVTNCETANIEKTITAAAAQNEDILYILNKRGLAYLPVQLQELAQLRLAHPEMSLSELGNALSKPLSRSGVNHRLRKISDLARELEKEAQ